MASDFAKALLNWVDDRFPLRSFWNHHLARYYVPKRLNFLYVFGALALFLLVNQIVTGIFLAMYYKPIASLAFNSIEYIMRDINWGWLIRYLHSTGASAFFGVIYLHMFRGVCYGSFKKPRELVWLFGMVLFLLLMAEAFMGYLLPWGQMSFWGAQVIISLFGSLPWVGDSLALWIRGDYAVADATLNRFFAFHVIGIPLALIAMVMLHVIALHKVGSNNPEGVEIHGNADDAGIPRDGIPFHPYYTVKDLFAVSVFLVLFAFCVFYWPDGGGYFLESANFYPADPLKTPEHIHPVWYFTPFYTILRAIPNKLGGMVAMGLAVGVLLMLPWLDTCEIKSLHHRGNRFKVALVAFAVSFIGLGVLGTAPITPTTTLLARVFSGLYFAFFLSLPLLSRIE